MLDAEKNEIIIYQPDTTLKLDVRVKDESVWLNRNQLAQLFGRDVKTIGKHVANALKEELAGISVVAKFAITAANGKVYQVEHYNLEMVTSIGYRVKSSRGIQFRNCLIMPHKTKINTIFVDIKPGDCSVPVHIY